MCILRLPTVTAVEDMGKALDKATDAGCRFRCMRPCSSAVEGGDRAGQSAHRLARVSVGALVPS